MAVTPADLVASEQIKARNAERDQRDQVVTGNKTIEMLVCPTEDCPGYHGSTLMYEHGRPEDDWTGLRGLNGESQPPDRARTRGDCWVCFEAGRGRIPMNRVRVTVHPGELRKPIPRPTTGRFAP